MSDSLPKIYLAKALTAILDIDNYIYYMLIGNRVRWWGSGCETMESIVRPFVS